MPNAKDMLAAGRTALANARANTGAGYQGEWPPAGEHPCLLIGISDPQVSKFQLGRTKTDIDCVNIQFRFREEPSLVESDPSDDRPPVSFDGREFQLILDEADIRKLPDNAQGLARKDVERFKGHMVKLLKLPNDAEFDAATGLDTIRAQIEEAPIPVVVLCEYYTPEGKTTTYKTEYITQHLG